MRALSQAAMLIPGPGVEKVDGRNLVFRSPGRLGKPMRVICSWLPTLALLLCAVCAGTCLGQVPSPPTPTGPPGSVSLPVVIELFTSEGCSSCPPADEFLRKLDTLQPVAGVQVIVLSEHVNYWDHDGWKDPNSSAALTDRQTDYERALHLGTPYTPQFIVDGAKEFHLNDPHQLEAVFQEAAAAPKTPVRIGAVNIDSADPPVLRTRVEADAVGDKHSPEVFLAVALDRVDSDVLKGENSGRHWVHVAVVQQIAKIGKLRKGEGFAEDVQLKLKPGTNPTNIRVVAFVQAPGTGRLLGAALWKSEH